MLKKKNLIPFLIFVATLVNGQGKDLSPEEYILKYKDIAIAEMERSGIPASIILAQGIHESASGSSSLAKKGNNHFGIKCHKWEGEKIYQNDDEQNECFRKYSSVKESFIDHTNHLMSNPRYEFLFKYPSNDYTSWARGLQKAGYATNPQYADKIIGLIKKYELYVFDERKSSQGKEITQSSTQNRQVFEKNYTKYIVVSQGDTYESLTKVLGFMKKELAKYNDIDVGADIVPGSILYLSPKKNKAQINSKTHVVKQGETMRSISQVYAVKLKKLYIYNYIIEGDEPTVGTVLNLRKKLKHPVISY